jgi:hypothetical protein
MRLRSNLLIKTATGLLHLKYIFFPFTFSKQPWHRVYRNTSVVVSIAAVVGLQPGMDAVARQPAIRTHFRQNMEGHGMEKLGILHDY